MRYVTGMDLSKYYDRYRYFPHFTELLFNDVGEGIRNRGYLTYEDLALIYVWKAILWQTHNEFTSSGLEKSESTIKQVTERIFKVDHNNQQEVTDLLRDMTESLHGVGLKVASAILSVVYPAWYGVVDFRVQRALCASGENADGYAKVLFRMREIAGEQESFGLERHWTARMVDMALYELDKSEL